MSGVRTAFLAVLCIVLAVVSGLAVLVFAYSALEFASGANALTLRVVSAGDVAGSGDAGTIQQAAADVRRAASRWGVGFVRVSVVDQEEGLIRLELAVEDSADLRRRIENPRRLVFKLVERELGSRVEAGEQIAEGTEIACAATGERLPCYLLNSTPVITAHDIGNARRDVDQSGEPALIVEFTDSAAERLRGFSAAHEGRRLAVVLDATVVAAPVLRGEFSDNAMIDGRFSEEEVRELAFDLQSGVLPTLRVVRGEPISPMPWVRPHLVGLGLSGPVLLASLAGIVFFAVRLVRSPGRQG